MAQLIEGIVLIRTLLALTLLSAALTACVAIPDAANTSLSIQRGMTVQEVMQVIDGPDFQVQRTFKGNGEALQFCTGQGLGSRPVTFVIVWFANGRVEGLTQYSEYVANYWAACSDGFREIDWGQAPADVRIKLEIE